MLYFDNVSVVYPDGTSAISGINLKITGGERVALIGANGAGKTSLMLAMMGVIPSCGTITVDGISLGKKTIHEVRSRIGMVFQNPDDQLFMPSIYDDIAFGLRNMGISEDEVERRAIDCLSSLNIGHLRNKTALNLSGGEKRVAALATVLVMEPLVMAFDEPSVFLDPKARRNLINILNTLPQTKIIATHDMTFAEETCDRCVLLKGGAIFADGPACELLYDGELMDECGMEAIKKCGISQ